MGNKAAKFFAFAIGTAAAWAYAIKPRTKNKPDMSVILNYDFANGGCHNFKAKRPENSLAAIEDAMLKGYGVVVDARLTRDGEAVAFADRELWRMCGTEGTVEKTKLAALKEFCLLDTEEKIPTIKEVLDLVDGQVPVIIRINTWLDNYGSLCSAVAEALDDYDGVFAVQSSDWKAIRWFKHYREGFIRGQMIEKTVQKSTGVFDAAVNFIQDSLLTNVFTRPDFISVHYPDRKNISLKLCKFLFFVPVFHWDIRTMDEYESSRVEDACVIFEDIEP